MNKDQATEIQRLASVLATARAMRARIRCDQGRRNELPAAQEKVRRADNALAAYLDSLVTGVPLPKAIHWFAAKASPDGLSLVTYDLGAQPDGQAAQAEADKLPGVTVLVLDETDAANMRAVFNRVLDKG